jgi:hypothetical protein
MEMESLWPSSLIL